MRPLALSASLLALALAGCGSSKVTTVPPVSLPTQPDPTEVTIKPAGVDPQVFHVFDGRKIKFHNADDKPHAIFSDKHPAHDTCGGILNMGTLQPGEEREITNLPLDACYFHDEGDPSAVPFQGVLVVH